MLTAPTPAGSPVSACGRETDDDSLVCYCFRRTGRQLREDHCRLGSLAALQKETRAGMSCGGCRVTLRSMFQEDPTDINVRPIGRAEPGFEVAGSQWMRGLVVSDGNLETVITSCNGIPPRPGARLSPLRVKYALLNASGEALFVREAVVAPNATFRFDTRQENLPKPFHGMFIYYLDRGNYGAARFNMRWTNGKSTAATHEINGSNRDMVLPINIDKAALEGPNTFYLAVLNPHHCDIEAVIRVFDVEGRGEYRYSQALGVGQTAWFNIGKRLVAPAAAALPQGRWCVRVHPKDFDMPKAPAVFFLIHNRNSDLWTANHV